MAFVSSLASALWRTVSAPVRRFARFCSLKWRLHGRVRFTRSVHIGAYAEFEGANSLGERSSFDGRMGYGSYICEDCHITGDIGRFTSIGAEVRTSQGVHPMTEPYATTSPMFYSLKKQSMVTFAGSQQFDEMRPPVSIGNDCWVGVRVFIAGGVRIGDGAIVLSGAAVTKNVPPYAIVGGVPAKVLRTRYDEATISWLLEKRWWDLPLDWLKENSDLLCDIERLKTVL